LNNCFSSATCTSMIAHFGGIASPVEAFSVVTESSQELRRRLFTARVSALLSSRSHSTELATIVHRTQSTLEWLRDRS
jgi:hypothetical protein